MFILAIDTATDETSAAVTWNDVILSNVISSQVELHKKYGGVVPMIAQRAHRERIDYVVSEAIKRANVMIKRLRVQKRPRGLEPQSISLSGIDVFAVTQGPGLAPALEVGVAKAKELAEEYKKPLIAVNHMEGHVYANFAKRVSSISNSQFLISKQSPNSKSTIQIGETLRQTQSTEGRFSFPILCLLISGGHTELVLMKSHGKYEILGETLDDAVGEAFDKVARMLGLGYPGGPIVELLAKEGNPEVYPLPIPMEQSKDLNFSYSGLKTAVLYTIRRAKEKQKEFSRQNISDLAASFQRVAIEHLAQKTNRAIKILRNNSNKPPQTLLLGGGVVANLEVRKCLRQVARNHGLSLVYPDNKLCTDNAAMIGVAAFYKAKRGEYVKNVSKLDRRPLWSLS